MLGADAVEDGEHLVLLDELARERDRLRDVELVVQVLVVDFPAEDATLRVDVLEVRVGTAAHRSVRRSGTGDGDRRSERDLGRRDARCRRRSAQRDRGRSRGEVGDHREIVFGRTGSVKVTFPTVSRDPSGTSLR